MRNFLDLILSWIVGVTLAISTFAHLANPYAFLDAVLLYGLVPGEIAKWVVVFAPFLQLTLAFCLISGLLRGGAWFIALPLFLGFSFVQSYAWLIGLGIPCGCFGASDAPIGWFSLSIVYSMSVLTIIALLLRKNRPAPTPLPLLFLAVLLFSPSAISQELTYPADSREESARIVVARLFRELDIETEVGRFNSAKEIADTLTEHGVSSRYFEKGQLGDLRYAEGATLLLLKNDWSSRGNTRWVLLLEISGDKATVLDPAVSADGAVTVSTAELLARWDGRGMFTARNEIAPRNLATLMRYLPLALFLFVGYLVWEMTHGKQRKPIPLSYQVGAILGFSLLFGLAYHFVLPTGLLKNDATEIVVKRFKPIVLELSLAETKEQLRSGDVLLFDTREAEKFAAGTIPGAVNFPVNAPLETSGIVAR